MQRIGIVGGGPTGIYLFKNLVEHGFAGLGIAIINPAKIGHSSPWSKPWACIDHLANIGSEEIPDLLTPIHKWLKTKSNTWLTQHYIKRSDLRPRGIYPRVVVGEYFHEQYVALCKKAASKGIIVEDKSGYTVVDVTDIAEQDRVRATMRDQSGETMTIEFDKLVIATGHTWEKDQEQTVKGLFETPWPIAKLENRQNHPVGLMGSSLSAVDVTLSMSMVHGRFERVNGKLVYAPNPNTDNFRVVMHSRSGVLPHLRHHFEFPRLEVYRYIKREDIELQVASNGGYLSLDFMFEDVFKKTIKRRDREFYAQIKDFNLEEFVAYMMAERKAVDPFLLMKEELHEAEKSIRLRTPIYWKEIIDDVIYTITFEGKLMSAEDMIRFEEVLMPFFSYLSSIF